MSDGDYSPPDTFHSTPRPHKKTAVPHYYGDLIRRLFLICGFIMVATLPFLSTRISTPLFFSLLGILVLVFFAGLTNPRTKWVIVVDIIISFLGFGIFSYQAIAKFAGVRDLYSATNFALALLFLFAFYFSVKTLRGIAFHQNGGMFKVVRESSENISPIPFAKDSPPDEKLSDEERRVKRFRSEENS